MILRFSKVLKNRLSLHVPFKRERTKNIFGRQRMAAKIDGRVETYAREGKKFDKMLVC